MIRRWSDHVYAVYVDDGMFGRRVGLIDVREEAENVAPQSLRGEDSSASNNGTIRGCAQRGVDALPPDDLNPILFDSGSEAPA